MSREELDGQCHEVEQAIVELDEELKDRRTEQKKLKQQCKNLRSKLLSLKDVDRCCSVIAKERQEARERWLEQRAHAVHSVKVRLKERQDLHYRLSMAEKHLNDQKVAIKELLGENPASYLALDLPQVSQLPEYYDRSTGRITNDLATTYANGWCYDDKNMSHITSEHINSYMYGEGSRDVPDGVISPSKQAVTRIEINMPKSPIMSHSNSLLNPSNHLMNPSNLMKVGSAQLTGPAHVSRTGLLVQTQSFPCRDPPRAASPTRALTPARVGVYNLGSRVYNPKCDSSSATAASYVSKQADLLREHFGINVQMPKAKANKSCKAGHGKTAKRSVKYAW